MAAALQARVEAGKLVKTVKIGEAIGRHKERYPRVARYYTMAYDPDSNELRFAVDADKRARADSLDGSYLLQNDRLDLSAEEA